MELGSVLFLVSPKAAIIPVGIDGILQVEDNLEIRFHPVKDGKSESFTRFQSQEYKIKNKHCLVSSGLASLTPHPSTLLCQPSQPVCLENLRPNGAFYQCNLTLPASFQIFSN